MGWTNWTDVISHLNYWAILVAGTAVMALGSVWYSKSMFADKWSKLSGVKDMRSGNMGALMGGTFILTLLSGWGLAILERLLYVDGWVQGLTFGLFVGLVFVSASTLINYMYEQRSKMLWKITAGYATLSLAVMAIILSVWH